MFDTDFSKSKSSGLFHIFETSKMSGALKIRSKCTGEHLCRNRTLAWVFSCTFAPYFQNTFLNNTFGRCFRQFFPLFDGVLLSLLRKKDCCWFFLSGFYFADTDDSYNSGRKEEIILIPFYHFHLAQKTWDI